jgi:ankyrin repeat protein
MTYPLHAAAQAGDMEEVRRLLATGQDLNARDAEGNTPLHLAAFNGQLDAVIALLAAGADANAQDAQGWTPIFKAAYNHEMDCGFAPVVQALADAGGDVNHRIFYGLTPLMLAAGGGEAAVCEVLLNAGAEVKAANEGGRTALAMAKERFFVDVINLLHEAEGFVMETEGVSCASGLRKGPPSEAKVVNFIKRPTH